MFGLFVHFSNRPHERRHRPNADYVKTLWAKLVLVDCNILTSCCPFFCLSITDHILYAAVSCVCDAQPGRFHSLLPERSTGQLPGRLSTGETKWTSTVSPLFHFWSGDIIVLQFNTSDWENAIRLSQKGEKTMGFRVDSCPVHKSHSVLSYWIMFWFSKCSTWFLFVRWVAMKSAADKQSFCQNKLKDWVNIICKLNYLPITDEQLVIIQNGVHLLQHTRKTLKRTGQRHIIAGNDW